MSCEYCHKEHFQMDACHPGDLLNEIDRLHAEREALWVMVGELVWSLDDLIAASTGVDGLHLNGDVAPWEELREGGNFQEWLQPFDEARRRLAEGNGK